LGVERAHIAACIPRDGKLRFYLVGCQAGSLNRMTNVSAGRAQSVVNCIQINQLPLNANDNFSLSELIVVPSPLRTIHRA
jgi:hypothetical protein